MEMGMSEMKLLMSSEEPEVKRQDSRSSTPDVKEKE
jgi:hypothetical protein